MVTPTVAMTAMRLPMSRQMVPWARVKLPRSTNSDLIFRTLLQRTATITVAALRTSAIARQPKSSGFVCSSDGMVYLKAGWIAVRGHVMQYNPESGLEVLLLQLVFSLDNLSFFVVTSEQCLYVALWNYCLNVAWSRFHETYLNYTIS